jgi:hypothetical protein
MLRDSVWQPVDNLRAQLAMFHALGDQIGLPPGDRGRAVELDACSWRHWKSFMIGGPLPAEPPVPEMLRRIGQAAFYLSVIAERIATEAGGQG